MDREFDGATSIVVQRLNQDTQTAEVAWRSSSTSRFKITITGEKIRMDRHDGMPMMDESDFPPGSKVIVDDTEVSFSEAPRRGRRGGDVDG